jgi:hypothetical protein
MPQQPAKILLDGQPITIHDVRISRLDQTGNIDLKTRKVSHPAAVTTDSIERGLPTQDSIASPIMMRSVVPPDET